LENCSVEELVYQKIRRGWEGRTGEKLFLGKKERQQLGGHREMVKVQAPA